MFLPCATVRRVMPGQISIVGFSRFIFRILRWIINHANIRFVLVAYGPCPIRTDDSSAYCSGSCVRCEIAPRPGRRHACHYNPDFSIFKLATHRGSLAESDHENIYPTDYNSVSDVDRNSLVCANNVDIASWCIGPECNPTGSFKRPAEPAGDDEANDGDVEVE